MSRVLFPRLGEAFEGDLPELLEKRIIRVLVTHSRTNFFLREGSPRGFEAELLLGYETFLNEAQGDRALGINVVFVPVPFGELLPALSEGLGDIAAAGLTVTPERADEVAFTRPYLPKVAEVVVAHRGVEGVDSLSALAGRTVVVTRGSSYAESLRRLSEELRSAGQAGIVVEEAEGSLETEDLLDLVNAGAVALTVADRHVAELWSEVLPDIMVRDDLEVARDRSIAWAVRPGSEKLLASLNGYLDERKKGTLLGNILFKRYYQNVAALGNPLADEDTQRLLELVPHFREYGERYGVDWLLVAAQAYRESRFDQSLRSRAGAVGVMQLLPTTAADDNVGIADISKARDNIHAGVKYLSFLRERYFSELEPTEALRFSLASYNAGPARVRQLRTQAAEQGLDPDIWFRNVEHAAADRIGHETVRYVSEINKYFIAYTMSLDILRQRGVELPAALAE